MPLTKKIIGNSPCMLELLDIVRKIAPDDLSVLILGETGTGKELIADAIHFYSLRNNKPFVKLNCGTLSGDLHVSELFGHRRGSFTGALETTKGLVTAADGGTLFLDEVGDLSLTAQAGILRFLQEGEAKPLGSRQTYKVDVRIISATNRNLNEAIEEGTFRKDLYYRLKMTTLVLPPLRNRREDIPALAAYFLKKYNRDNISEKDFSREATTWMMSNQWDGNIRELENAIRNALSLSNGKKLIGPKEISGTYQTIKTPQPLGATQKAILDIMKKEGRITVKSIASRFCISDRAIELRLQHLMDMGLVRAEGGRKYRSYILV